MLRHSPTLWLHQCEVNTKSLYIVDKLDKDALGQIVNISDDDLKLVFGRYEYDLIEALKRVETEITKDGFDLIDKFVKEKIKLSNIYTKMIYLYLKKLKK